MEASFFVDAESSPGVHYKPGGREGCGVVGPARDRRACVPEPDRPVGTPPCRGLWLFGAPAGYEQSCTAFALARGFHYQEEAVLLRFAIAGCHVHYFGEAGYGESENSRPTARRWERVGCLW